MWSYHDREGIARRVAAGAHRDVVGGMWDEIGALQLDFLIARGLTPASVLLDVGCGSLRLGARAVRFLEPGRYWGTDLNQSLLDAGWEREIVPAGLAERLPRDQLVVDADFSFPGVPPRVDFVMAQSVFTHLPFNDLRLCLARLAAHLEGPATVCVTLFLAPGEALHGPYRQARGGTVTHPAKDPFHYCPADVAHAVRGLPWTAEIVGDWGHPRDQKMVVLRKEA